MRIPSAHSRRSSLDLQTAMTPLIDVVFQLLIFFICASTGHLRELLLATDFAESGTIGHESVQPVERPLGEVWIHMIRDGDRTKATLESREFENLAELESSLRALAEITREIPVYLNIGPSVPLEDFVTVYDACRASGFSSINFAVGSDLTDQIHTSESPP